MNLITTTKQFQKSINARMRKKGLIKYLMWRMLNSPPKNRALGMCIGEFAGDVLMKTHVFVNLETLWESTEDEEIFTKEITRTVSHEVIHACVYDVLGFEDTSKYDQEYPMRMLDLQSAGRGVFV